MNWKRKALSLLLSAALVSSLAAPALAMTPPTDSAVPDTLADGFSDDPTRYEIYPVPHHIEYPSDAAKIVPTSTVNVIAEEGIDSYTLAFLREILSSYGLTMNQTDKIASGQTNILLGIHGSEGTADAAAPEPKTYDDLFTSYDKVVDGKYDPYLMAVTADEPRGTITIVGADSDGVYCGLATLQMMFSSFSGRYLLPVTIEDYSNSRFRGFVEGFYGGFDYVGRESQMRSIRDVKGNMYVFASKNDRYHAEDWDKLYPEDELKQIAHLVQVGEETKVDYAWSVHIGKGGFFNGASSDPDSGTKYEKYLENVEKLEVKFQQLYDVGVRNFHILNDDYNSGTNADVVALLNTMNGWLKEKGCGPLVYCCKGYNTAWAGNGAELNALQELDEDIYLYWTGADVNSPINQDNVNWPHSKSGHYTVTWLNYPCSEHAKSGMFLGDISHYVSNADGLTNNLGILSNPVNYPEANKVAYFQLLSWAWNRDSYSTYITQLWEDCFKYLQPEVYDSYLAIARNVSNCPDSGRIPNGFPESEYLKDKLAAVQEKVLSGSGDLKNDPDVQALLDEFAHILSAVEDFRDNCANAALVKELEPWLKSLSGVAQAGKGGLEAAIALADGNLEGAWAGFSSASLGLDQWDNYDTPNYAGTKAKAGSKRLQPFASKVVEYVGAELNTALNPGGLGGGAPTFYGRLGGKNLSATANSDRMFDGKDGTYAAFDSGYVQQQGDYFGVDLGKVQTVTNIRILQGADDSDQNYFHKAVLQCSANGKDWVELTGRVNAQEIHYERPISARYVRLYLEEIGYPNPDDSGYKPDYWTRVREFTVETAGEGGLYTSVEVPESTKVTEDGGVYTLSGLSNVTLAPGGYVGLDLGEVVGVKSISAKDLDGSLTLQYSANGLVWTVCGAEPSPFSARYCRVVNLGEEAVTETLPDLEVTLSDPKLTPSMVKTNVNTVNAGAWANVFDGDVSTYVQTKTNQAEGQYFIFDLGASVPVYDLKFYTHESNDYIYYMDIAIGNSSSPDGEWTTIGTVDNNTQMDPPYRTFSCDGGGREARYLKLTVTQAPPKNQWLILNEIEINKARQQSSSLGAFSGSPVGDFEKTMDGQLSTIFAPGAVTESGGYLQYLISEDNDISSVKILQESGSVCDAAVKVQTADGQWHELGALDMAVSVFDTAGLGGLTALRLEWKPGTSPAIAEIILLSDEGTASADQAPAVLPSIFEVSPVKDTSIEVNFGTPENMVGLPVQGVVTLSGGQRMVLPLEWSCEDYDAEQPGKYTFTGAYDLTGLNLTNPGGFTVTGQVTVRQDPDAVPEEPEPAPSGTPIDLTTSCQVTASGTEQNNDQWAPEKLVDGDSSTRWSAVPNMKQKNDRNPENQTKGVEWVNFDLATGNEMSGDYQENEPIYLTEITVKGTAQNKAWPTDYEIQVSDTAEENSWKTVATFHCDSADHKGTEDQVTELDPNTAQGRYLRILVNGMNIYADAATAVSIDDVVVMGYQADADPAHQAMPLAASQAVDLIHDTDDGAAREVYVSGREVANATGPEFAVDGKEDTYWSGNGMKKQGDATDQLPSWIVVDLGENVESIFNVTMQFNKKVWPTELVIQAATSTYNPTDYADINVFREKRDDGLGDAIKGDNAESANIWHNLATKSCDSLSDTPTVVVDNLSAIPEGTRYLRVFFKSMNGVAAGHAIGLKELNVYGTRFAPVVKVDPEIKSVVPVVATAIAGEVAQARLPGRVVAVLADDSRVALEVTWSLDEADDSPTEEIPVIVTGTITLPDDESVKNTGNVSASMNLTLTDEPKVDGSVPVKVNPSTLTVAAGTDVESLNLPASVSVQMDNGLVVVCPVTWDTSTYDPKLMGPQTITGTYTYDPSHSLLRAAGSGAITGKVEITVIPVRSAPEDVTVSFDSNGGTPVETQTVEYNTPVSKPEDPTRDGFTFDGWYLDYGLERPWDFDRKVTSSLTLYAKWTEDTSDDSHSASSSSGSSSYRARASVRGDGSVELSSNRPRVGQTVTVSIVPGEGMYLAQIQAVTTDGKAVALTKVSENRYTFVQPRGAVTVSATFLPLSGGEETHFFDVEPSAWYAEAVRFVVEQGIMQGIGGGLFDPSGVMNRSMLVTMLHRLAGEPGGGTASFTDVSAGIWYSDAVAWAASAELTGGYGDGRFGPTDAVTREQVAALLFRYAQLQKLELAADQSVPDFSDTASVSGWAKEAMDWAVRTGLLSGKNGGILDPLGTATRAEVVAILMRFSQSTVEAE